MRDKHMHEAAMISSRESVRATAVRSMRAEVADGRLHV